MLHLTFPAKHFSGKYVTTKHFDLFFHMFQRLSVLKRQSREMRYWKMTVIRWLNAIAQLPPSPLILHWVNPGENWPTVGLWGWQKSADLPLLPPSPALHTSWRATTSASKKTLTVSCCPCYCNCCSCKWMSVQVIPTFWDPGSRNWVENGRSSDF